jgi:hypothetical protein
MYPLTKPDKTQEEIRYKRIPAQVSTTHTQGSTALAGAVSNVG